MSDVEGPVCTQRRDLLLFIFIWFSFLYVFESLIIIIFLHISHTGVKSQTRESLYYGKQAAILYVCIHIVL